MYVVHLRFYIVHFKDIIAHRLQRCIANTALLLAMVDRLKKYPKIIGLIEYRINCAQQNKSSVTEWGKETSP